MLWKSIKWIKLQYSFRYLLALRSLILRFASCWLRSDGSKIVIKHICHHFLDPYLDYHCKLEDQGNLQISPIYLCTYVLLYTYGTVAKCSDIWCNFFFSNEIWRQVAPIFFCSRNNAPCGAKITNVLSYGGWNSVFANQASGSIYIQSLFDYC